ncbi:hypothetical protein [uncultured Tolumonas sp.]|nr:hypothetical protein [uncultured Tolumonas sp.]
MPLMLTGALAQMQQHQAQRRWLQPCISTGGLALLRRPACHACGSRNTD